MNYASMQMFSPALNKHVTYHVILPPDEAGDGPFPVLYQLHGLTDDSLAWTRNSNLVRHARRWPLIVVMPDGGTSFYMNSGPQTRYEDFIVEDLAASVARTFHVRPGKAAIGGLSMGGYGALRLGLRHPDKFCSVWAHSSAVLSADEAITRYSWESAAARELDIYRVTDEALKNTGGAQGLPRLALDCGTEDFLLDFNRNYVKFLRERGVKFDYEEHPGAHEWDYWDRHVPTALARHAEVLGLQPVG